MSESKLDKFINAKIVDSYIIELYQETTYFFNEQMEIVREQSKYLSKDKAITLAEKQKKQKTKLMFIENYLSLSSIDPEFEIEPPEGGGDSYSIYRSLFVSTEYKYIYVHGVYISGEGNNGQFHLNINVKWLTNPSETFVDVLTVGYMDNVQLAEDFIDGEPYPYLYSEFSYNKLETYYVGTDVYEYVTSMTPQTFDGGENENYCYDIQQQFIGVEYDLLDDEIYISDLMIYTIDYIDLEMSLELLFIPTTSTLTATTFSTFYTHQIGSGYIDWGQVSVTYLPPYFSYTTGEWVDDPEFDDGIGGHIIFQDII